MKRPRGRINGRRERITAARLGRESEGEVVAWKRGNARGAKGPCRIYVPMRREEDRLGMPQYGIQPLDRDGSWARGQAGYPPVRALG